MILKSFAKFINEESLYKEGTFKGTDQEALKHIKRAVLFLRMHHRFFSSLINATNIEEDDTLPFKTMATDGFVVLYHPEYVHNHSHQEIMFVIAHEIMHNTMGHFARQGDRHGELWNIAADYAINPLIEGSIKDKDNNDVMIAPKGILLDKKYSGKSAEWIYEHLMEKEIKPRVEKERKQKGGSPQPQPGQGQPGQGQPGQGQPGQGQPGQGQPGQGQPGQGQPGQGQPGQGQSGGMPGGGPPPTNDEISRAIADMMGEKAKEKGGEGSGTGDWNIGETKPGGTFGEAKDKDGKKVSTSEMARRIKDLSRKAARAMGGKFSAGSALDQWLKGLAEPKVDWVAELNRFLRASLERSKDKIPYRRFAGRGEYFPGPGEDESLRRIVIGVDTSGSITPKMLDQFSTEISSIVGNYEIDFLDVLYCDTAIVGHDNYRNPSELNIKKMPGGGGTLFNPMFDWVEANLDGPPDAMIIFTDGWPNSNNWGMPDFDDNNVIWIIANNPDKKGPYGHTIPVQTGDDD